MGLVLSLFPGIGLLDRAFEEDGHTVVRGPDVLWGGDIKAFHPPAGRFDGIIGGPPCQSHSTYAAMNIAQGKRVAEDLVPEFIRVVTEARPLWWVMENSPGVPDISISGYHQPPPVVLNNRELGQEQLRIRKWQFGFMSHVGQIQIETTEFRHENTERPCLASEGATGIMSHKRVDGAVKASYTPRRPFERFCELQGLPSDFGEHLPFTMAWKYRVVGNGVPLPMGRAIAKAVRSVVEL